MTSLLIGVVFIVIAIILSVVAYGFILKRKKQRIQENKLLVNRMFDKAYQDLRKEGVESIDKTYRDTELLPKNEILYSKMMGTIKKQRTLASGNVKITVEGRGHILITDKAITIESSSLSSGKRRYLYKNIYNNLPFPVDSEHDTLIGFYYNQKNLVFIKVGEKEMKSIAMAFFLKNNPIKADDSISF